MKLRSYFSLDNKVIGACASVVAEESSTMVMAFGCITIVQGVAAYSAALARILAGVMIAAVGFVMARSERRGK